MDAHEKHGFGKRFVLQVHASTRLSVSMVSSLQVGHQVFPELQLISKWQTTVLLRLPYGILNIGGDSSP